MEQQVPSRLLKRNNYIGDFHVAHSRTLQRFDCLYADYTAHRPVRGWRPGPSLLWLWGSDVPLEGGHRSRDSRHTAFATCAAGIPAPDTLATRPVDTADPRFQGSASCAYRNWLPLP